MKGLILINAYSTEEEYLYQPYRLREELIARGVSADVVRNDLFALTVEENVIRSRYTGYDFCVYWDKDKYLLNMLEKSGMRVFNRYRAIEACDDKMTTYIALAGLGIPMPRTLAGLLCFSQKARVEERTVTAVEHALGYPLVAKYSYGSLGQGVFLVENREQLKQKMEEMKCAPHLFQEFVRTSYGKDLRVLVLGGRVLGAMLRTGGVDFRSNIGAGGKGEMVAVSEAEEEIALKIASVLELDYCGVDILFGEKGPVVCEVNSNAYFCAFERVTGVNVAGAYADYILNVLG